jgi:putative restriction endonuclease
MAFGVFIHRPDSIYDDSPAERYQFSRQYLGRASSCVGDWIVYYEPRRSATSRGYYAIARLEKVVPDPKAPGMYLGLIEPGSYLDFAVAVPFRDEQGPVERGLLNAQGRLSGNAQAAVRIIEPADFNRIVSRGLHEGTTMLPRTGEAILPGLAEELPSFSFERERSSFLSSRIVRDRVFRRRVLDAYDERCAVTGLKLINGHGRAEVVAAHIRPVEKNGPDIVRNGVALSGTAHWMFDRGLITFSDEFEIKLSRHVNDRDGALAMINKTGRLIGPANPSDAPHRQYLEWHRTYCFKG